MEASLVRVSGEAKFDTASAGDNKTVTFIATELTGRKAANYEFESPDAMQAMAEASITPLNVTFTLGALTFGYDTDEKTVTVSAFDETGALFTDYDIVYRDADGNDLVFVPKDAGSYLVGIEITDSNYVTDYTDKEMFIIEADQEALSILGLPGTVAFGDEFTLEAIGGSGTGALIWESSSPDVTVEPENGNSTAVTVKINGAVGERVTITLRKEADNNYSEEETKVIFIPVVGANVKVTVTATDDAAVTTARNAGSYLVRYEITDDSFKGSGSDVLYINKAHATISAKDKEKVYGDENPELELTGLFVGDEASYESVLKKMFTVSCEADEKSPVGEYPIKVTLNEGYTLKDDKNYNFTIGEDGILTVKKAVLTVTVSDIERTYGVATPDPEYKITGFKAGDTGKVVTGKPVFTFKDGTDGSANAGTYADAVTMEGLTADNYEFNYVYASGSGADLTVNKKAVKDSAGTAKKNFIKVKFSALMEGLTAANFTVTKDGEPVTVSVTASNDKRKYTLTGEFTLKKAYDVSVTASDNYILTGNEFKVTPRDSSSSGGSSSVGGSSSGSGRVTTYTVSFETNGVDEISDRKVEKNGTLKRPDDPEKKGFIFTGWFTDKSLKKEYDFERQGNKEYDPLRRLGG